MTLCLALYLHAEGLHVVAPRRGGALDRRLLLVDLADLLVELAVALGHLASILRDRFRWPGCRGASGGGRRRSTGVGEELARCRVHLFRLLVEGGLVLLHAGHRLLAVFTEDRSDLVLALVDLAKTL